MRNKKFGLIIICAIFLVGCSAYQCKPTLMPYSEYGYKAVQQQLPDSYVPKDEKVINFKGIQLAVLKNWNYKEEFSGKSLKISKNKDTYFLFSHNENKAYPVDAKTFNLIGCADFKADDHGKIKTQKDFFKDLYLFTDDQLEENENSFWPYAILRAKTDFLRDAKKLSWYKGKNIEAYLREIKSGKGSKCVKRLTRIEIFPKQLEEHYFTIIAEDMDTAFFEQFLDMIDTLNPSQN
ncbi:MAG: hypothetical protein GY874_08260 [Desulfobacteraceae bacterium]|nr:hypothetical protein [Desulfobacteraceae bacterium]